MVDAVFGKNILIPTLFSSFQTEIYLLKNPGCEHFCSVVFLLSTKLQGLLISLNLCFQEYHIYYSHHGISPDGHSLYDPQNITTMEKMIEINGLEACERYLLGVAPVYKSCPLQRIQSFVTMKGIFTIVLCKCINKTEVYRRNNNDKNTQQAINYNVMALRTKVD